MTRAYDKAGRLEKVTDWLEHATKFVYDADSDLSTTTFPTGTTNIDKYVYNEADQMSEVKITKGAETLASLLYTRDNDGQVKKTTSKSLPGPEITENTYDENNRLTKAGTSAYEYDSADNATKIPGSTNTYDNASELKTGTSLTYAYDELGERTKRTPTTGPATTYGYDEAENLTSVERPKEGEVTEIKNTYAYDGNGLRASQTISGATSYPVWDISGSLPLLINGGTNNFIYGPGDLPVEQINSEGKALYFHHDQQGSTRMLTSSTGISEGTATYDAYGNKTGGAGTATTSLGYDSQYSNGDGLTYMRARAYDPTTAQFLSVDPLRAFTGAPYAYATDDPSNVADPTGLFSIGEVTGAVGDAASAVGEGVQTAGTFVVEHPVIISAVGCTVGALAGPEVCAGAIATSYAISTRNNINEYINGSLNASQLLDKQLLTAGVSVLGAAPGLPLLSSGTAALLEQSPTFTQLLVNGYLEAPDLAFGLIEPQIGCSLGLP